MLNLAYKKKIKRRPKVEQNAMSIQKNDLGETLFVFILTNKHFIRDCKKKFSNYTKHFLFSIISNTGEE